MESLSPSLVAQLIAPTSRRKPVHGTPYYLNPPDDGTAILPKALKMKRRWGIDNVLEPQSHTDAMRLLQMPKVREGVIKR